MEADGTMPLSRRTFTEAADADRRGVSRPTSRSTPRRRWRH
ncbi:hypothetical protein ACTMU2_04505 [Cupriavidus basilensis]